VNLISVALVLGRVGRVGRVRHVTSLSVALVLGWVGRVGQVVTAVLTSRLLLGVVVVVLLLEATWSTIL
jgi:hypothetical protein